MQLLDFTEITWHQIGYNWAPNNAVADDIEYASEIKFSDNGVLSWRMTAHCMAMKKVFPWGERIARMCSENTSMILSVTVQK